MALPFLFRAQGLEGSDSLQNKTPLTLNVSASPTYRYYVQILESIFRPNNAPADLSLARDGARVIGQYASPGAGVGR
ncbi:hypothetical protein GCM10011533_14570 [Streptosporangium jomthongense]|nr:hypothetical protein GCM10011533_14570 [Streptosporangium jomthongense]